MVPTAWGPMHPAFHIIIVSKIHPDNNDFLSFSLLYNILLYGYSHNVFTSPPVDIYLGCVYTMYILYIHNIYYTYRVCVFLYLTIEEYIFFTVIIIIIM